jgi:hypothetical protein
MRQHPMLPPPGLAHGWPQKRFAGLHEVSPWDKLRSPPPSMLNSERKVQWDA